MSSERATTHASVGDLAKILHAWHMPTIQWDSAPIQAVDNIGMPVESHGPIDRLILVGINRRYGELYSDVIAAVIAQEAKEEPMLDFEQVKINEVSSLSNKNCRDRTKVFTALDIWEAAAKLGSADTSISMIIEVGMWARKEIITHAWYQASTRTESGLSLENAIDWLRHV